MLSIRIAFSIESTLINSESLIQDLTTTERYSKGTCHGSLTIQGNIPNLAEVIVRKVKGWDADLAEDIVDEVLQPANAWEVLIVSILQKCVRQRFNSCGSERILRIRLVSVTILISPLSANSLSVKNVSELRIESGKHTGNIKTCEAVCNIALQLRDNILKLADFNPWRRICHIFCINVCRCLIETIIGTSCVTESQLVVRWCDFAQLYGRFLANAVLERELQTSEVNSVRVYSQIQSTCISSIFRYEDTILRNCYRILTKSNHCKICICEDNVFSIRIESFICCREISFLAQLTIVGSQNVAADVQWQ